MILEEAEGFQDTTKELTEEGMLGVDRRWSSDTFGRYGADRGFGREDIRFGYIVEGRTATEAFIECVIILGGGGCADDDIILINVVRWCEKMEKVVAKSNDGLNLYTKFGTDLFLDIVYSTVGNTIDFDTCHGVENGCQGDLGGADADEFIISRGKLNLDACVVDCALR